MASFASRQYEAIVTCDDDEAHILRKPTGLLPEEEWPLAHQAVKQLLYVRNEILKGGAGLAAPQVGFSYPIFIYTPDRTTESIRIVINPSFEPLGSEMIEGCEACFSVPLCCTKLKRWKRIQVQYQTLEGIWVKEKIEDFEAKVFQHEIDHLQGKLTIDHEAAEIMTFTNPQKFEAYMKLVHCEDAKYYNKIS